MRTLLRSLSVFKIAAIFSIGVNLNLSAAGPGTTSGNFLKIPVGARSSSMGSAYTGLSDDILALAYNPAGLTGLGEKQLSLQHNKYFEGMSHQWLGFAMPVENGGLGFGINSFRSGDIDSYDDQGLAQGSVNGGDLALNLAYARLLGFPPGPQNAYLKNFSAGANIKYIRSNLSSYNASAFAADLGFMGHTGIEGLKFGFLLENILASKMKFINESAPLYRRYKLGVSYTRAFSDNFSGVYSADLVNQRDGKNYAAFGIENVFYRTFALRVGYESFSDLYNGFSAGFGFDLRSRNFPLSLDYSFTNSADFGPINRVGLTYKFAGNSPTGRSGAEYSGTRAEVIGAGSASGEYPGTARLELKPEVLPPGSGKSLVDETVDSLVAQLNSPDAGVKMNAIAGLGIIVNVRSFQPLRELYLVESDRKVRLAILSAIGNFEGEPVFDVFKNALRDRAWEIRRKACVSLAELGDARAIIYLNKRTKDRNKRVREAATASISRLKKASK